MEKQFPLHTAFRHSGIASCHCSHFGIGVYYNVFYQTDRGKSSLKNSRFEKGQKARSSRN